ncbi:MAG: NUDIX domain-containing protein, partial [Verrucomicrobia bacterium]|nr:NUDIX domain-containing protein [Verrucomicrobiota bacterium]
PQWEIIEGDALKFDTRRAFALQPVKLVGNLPYYASSPLLFHFTAEPCPFEKLILTLQKELADRLVARPGTKEYGAITLKIQVRWNVSRLKTLPPTVFLPAPQVQSSVVLLTARPAEQVESCDRTLLDRLITAGFSERRKQVRKLLLSYGDSSQIREALTAAGLSESARGEEISLRQWIRITHYLSPPDPVLAQDEEILDVVDAQDKPCYPLDRKSVHAERLLHRAIHVFVTNPLDELFLQKRSFRKDTHPRKWDSSAAGHVAAGETYQDCAYRELREEMGITAELTQVGKLNATKQNGYEFIVVFAGVTHTAPRCDDLEIETGGYFPFELIDTWIARRPADFAPAFLECYRLFRAHQFKPQ